MHELGEIIKQARESKGLTYEDLNKLTKIRIRYLKAIEQGEWGILPGEVYLKGFIRNISRELDLNYEDLMNNHYYERTETPVDEETNNTDDQSEVFSGAVEKKSGFFKWLLIIAMCALVAYGAYYMLYVRNGDPTSLSDESVYAGDSQMNEPDSELDTVDDDQTVDADSEPGEVENSEPDEVSDDQPQLLLVKERSSATERYCKIIADKAEIVISVPKSSASESWVGTKELDSHGDYDGFTLYPGQSRTIEIDTNTVMLIGKPGVTQLQILEKDLIPGSFDGEAVESPVSYKLLFTK